MDLEGYYGGPSALTREEREELCRLWGKEWRGLTHSERKRRDELVRRIEGRYGRDGREVPK